ncbi:MAG: T9SS type A sorting domain-containing protein [Saprospiraceae bacterium]|nr:T9SS type A sorting domain-containing protein [Saprospiraceae bacterium]
MRRKLFVLFSMSLYLSNGFAQSINPQILWATYFGSPGDDFTGYVITDKDDNIYMTSMVEDGAPTTTGVHQRFYGGGVSDVMLSKFDKNGALIWSTYFGGSGEDQNYHPLVLMSDGGIVVPGITSSTNRISTPGSHDVTYGGGTSDVFLAVFETDGQLRWATYFGGSGTDGEPAVSIDSEDNIYLVGYTSSLSGIATDSSFQSVKKANQDGFLAKFDKSGKLQWSTYYGGEGFDGFWGVAVDQNNNVYAGGESFSSGLATGSSFFAGNGDGFLAKFNKDGKRIWANYFGSGGKEAIYYLAIDNNNDIICIGPSNSTAGIATPGAFQENNAGKNDVFIVKFNSNGQRLWSTFFGGEEWDTAFGCDFDADNNIYVSVMSQSYFLPLTEDVPGTFYNGGLWDAAFVKFSPSGELVWSTYFGGDGNDRSIGITLDSEQNIIAAINSDSKGLATPGAYKETAIGHESLLVKMKDATTVNVQDLTALPQMTIFPNPSSDFIEISNESNRHRTISFYDINGALVLRYMNSNQNRFDIRNLKSGLYFLHSVDKKVESFGKFIKSD